MATASAERNGILPFAFDLYDYLFTYYGLKASLPACYGEMKNSNSRFTSEIGEAVLGISYAFRIALKKRFNAMMPALIGTEPLYKHYMEVLCKKFMQDVFRISTTRVMRIMIVFAVGAFVSELTVYAHRRAMQSALEIAPSQFKYIFDKHVASIFFGAGGWKELNREAAKLSQGYHKLQEQIDNDPELEVDPMNCEQLCEYFKALHDLLIEREQAEGSESDANKELEQQSETEIIEKFKSLARGLSEETELTSPIVIPEEPEISEKDSEKVCDPKSSDQVLEEKEESKP